MKNPKIKGEAINSKNIIKTQYTNDNCRAKSKKQSLLGQSG